MPDFALTWEDEAIEQAMYWTGCQPFLLQMVGVQVVNRLAPTERRTVTRADVKALVPLLFDEGRYYFQSLDQLFDNDDKQALQEVATTGQTTVRDNVIDRLVDREYLAKSENGGWQFRVPLLAEWYRRQAESTD